MSQPLVVAVIAPGEMGAGLGRRLAANGVRVLTSLAGRSEDSVRRAQATGMIDASDAEIAAADMILSVLPPADAVALARRLAPALRAAFPKAIYVDCNAVSPATAQAVGAEIAAAGAPFADAGIIGLPPTDAGHTPRLYVSGEPAPEVRRLADFGLDVRVLDGPIGQASALKLSYSALNKGLYAIGMSAFLGAIEAGVAEPFREEAKSTLPQVWDYLAARTPGIFDKSHRWVAEMEEIGAFLGGGGEELYDGAARQFARLAGDRAGDKTDEAAIRAFLKG